MLMVPEPFGISNEVGVLPRGLGSLPTKTNAPGGVDSTEILTISLTGGGTTDDAAPVPPALALPAPLALALPSPLALALPALLALALPSPLALALALALADPALALDAPL